MTSASCELRRPGNLPRGFDLERFVQKVRLLGSWEFENLLGEPRPGVRGQSRSERLASRGFSPDSLEWDFRDSPEFPLLLVVRSARSGVLVGHAGDR